MSRGPGGAVSDFPTTAGVFDNSFNDFCPDGGSVYIANSGDDSVSQYDVGAGGPALAQEPATVATDFAPGAVAVSPAAAHSDPQGAVQEASWRDFPQFRNAGGCVSFVQKHR